jgi:hypothetical protein
MTTKTDDITLPTTPNRTLLRRVMPNDYRYGDIYGYTVEQMRGYARAAVEADRARRGEATAADAMAILRAALSADPDYAWGWHCAVWAAAHDEGLETGAANRAAARFMHAAFDVDTTKSPNFNPEHLVAEKERQ